MREASGSTWSLQIMILFILIFSAFIALVITYSKAYTVKNRIVTVLEKYEFINDETINIINSFLVNRGYRETHHCPTDEESVWYGVPDLNGNEYEKADSTNNYYYCFSEKKYNDGSKYFDIYVFYRFKLPFLGDIITYDIHGKTKGLLNTGKKENNI